MKWFNKKVLISVVCSLFLLSSGIVYGEVSIPKKLTLTSLTICVSSEGEFRSIKELTGACKPKESEVTLKGEQGAVGPAGTSGPQGPKGDSGTQGVVGPTGPQGVKGDTGAVGPQGPAGISPEEITALKTTITQLQTAVANLQAKVFPVQPPAGAPATITPSVSSLTYGTKDIAQPVTFTVKDANGIVVANSNVTVTVACFFSNVGTVSNASGGTYGASATVATNASGVATVYFKPGANYASGGGTDDILTATDGTASASMIYYHQVPF